MQVLKNHYKVYNLNLGGDCENIEADTVLHGCVWPNLTGTDYQEKILKCTNSYFPKKISSMRFPTLNGKYICLLR